ncbi:hypothetical protein F4805DRAFT_442878 [Annulohypoxylon moriforme]|nr:hypothetical protein F4805DRAFT_442878 [Annulohypoxylon moriforme]
MNIFKNRNAISWFIMFGCIWVKILELAMCRLRNRLRDVASLVIPKTAFFSATLLIMADSFAVEISRVLYL